MSAFRRARRCSRALSRTAIAGVVATAGIVLFAIPALAHITVTPGSAQPGSAAVLTFHVPNEEAKADTTRVDMQIPTDHPIAQLLVKPVPGWTISVRTITLAKPLATDDGQFTQAVSEVIWSGGRIAPGQFQDFAISADPLPQGVSRLPFKAIQTYSNGDVVRWIDVAQPGQPEPDHPAPVLTLSAGPAAAAPAAAPPAAAATSGSDGTARGIAIGGAAIGLLGLALAGLSWRRGKPAVVAEPPARDLNGHDPAMARKGASSGRRRTHR
jgi:periplasmic copper chaperone A